MKLKFAILLLSLLSTNVHAQVKGGVHEKLADLFVMDRFEDCLFKAQVQIEKDKYRSDPETMLYISMCYAKIKYVDPEELDEEYKDPIKDAMKWAAKAYKKDKKLTWYQDNLDYFNDLKAEGILHGDNWIEQEQFRKAASSYKMVSRFAPEDYNILFMKGVCEVLSRNTGEAMRSLNAAVPKIKENYGNPDYRPDRQSEPKLKEAILMYTEYLSGAALADSAKSTIAFGMELFGTDEEISSKYDQLYGTNTTEENKKEEAGQPKVFNSEDEE